MAKIAPFAGWRYNGDKVYSLSEVIVPPYDVISPQELARLQKKNAYNFSRVILPEGENKHQNAAALFKKWQNEKIFVQDNGPRLYFYRQKFRLKLQEMFCQSVDGKSELTRTGIFCRVKVEDYASKVILPHEKTFSGPKADRYLLMEAAQGNMEPVFLGYDSPRFSGDEFAKITASRQPEMTYKDADGVTHELWAVADAQTHGQVEQALAALKFYILDGHHRYETALKFYKDHESQGRPSMAYVMANICAFQQPGTIILPTHRALKGINGLDAAAVAARVGGLCDLKTNLSLTQLEELMRAAQGPVFGFHFAEGDYGLMTYKANREGRLDLEVLHGEILPALSGGRGLDEDQIGYFKDFKELEIRLSQGEYQMGILVKPSSAGDVMRTAENGKVMPHKSTFFYPKIPSGLVVNLFE